MGGKPLNEPIVGIATGSSAPSAAIRRR
jgi:hypothetical protein